MDFVELKSMDTTSTAMAEYGSISTIISEYNLLNIKKMDFVELKSMDTTFTAMAEYGSISTIISEYNLLNILYILHKCIPVTDLS